MRVTALDAATIQQRNDALEKQLEAYQLASMDVMCDRNCFYRAVFVSVYGDQSWHGNLRRDLANYVVRQREFISPAEVESLKQLAADIKTDGSWAGEDVIVVTANYLQQSIYVYFASEVSSLSKYLPDLPLTPLKRGPVLIAFYEPGHFQAVGRKPGQNEDGSKLSAASLGAAPHLNT